MTKAPWAMCCIALSISSCRSKEEAPWARIDLTEVRAESAPARRQSVPLGPESVRSINRRRTVSASLVRALKQQPGERWVWDVVLGRDAFFQFRPMLVENDPCICRYRIHVEANGATRDLGQLALSSTRSPAPVVIDLRAYHGKVRLILELESDGSGGSAFWVSPAIYHRVNSPRARPPRNRPDVILIAVDTLRSDYLGAYGAGTGASPNIDRFARMSDVWLEAHSTANATNPSFASIMTGLYPKHHGVYDLATPLDLSHETMAEILAKSGYDTVAILAASHLSASRLHITQGFDRVLEPPFRERLSGERVVDQAMDVIAAEGPDPLFLWIHLFDPHTPHTPPEPFGSGARFADTWTLRAPRRQVPESPRLEHVPSLGRTSFSRRSYAREVAFMDYQIGRLLAFLDSRGAFDSTVVAFVADHGEQLGEHGNFIGHQGLFETVTHVPMMIHWPGQREGRRIPGTAQSFDLFPTLLRAAHSDVPDGIDAVDLRSLGPEGRPYVFAEAAHRRGTMVRSQTHKLIRFGDDDHAFDLRRDPHETSNLTGEQLPFEALLSGRLQRFVSDTTETNASPVTLTREEVETLEALGYVP